MLGTNDIRGSMGRRQTSGNRVHEKLTETALKIKDIGPQVAITQIPPMTQPDHDIQVVVLNTKLELNSEPGLQIIKHNIRKAPKEKTLERDGFHLTDYGGRIIAQAINENVPEITRKPEPKPEINIRIHKIETTQERAKFIIGKQGTRITTLKEKHNVNIYTENKREGNQSTCTITIKGPGPNTNEAAAEINKIIDDAKHTLRKAQKEKEEQDRGKEVCRFYLRGECTFGSRCRNGHPVDTHQQDKHSHNPKRCRSPSNQRSTSRNKNPTRLSSHYHRESSRQRTPDRRHEPTKSTTPHRYQESPKASTSYHTQESPKPSSSRRRQESTTPRPKKYQKKETITRLDHQ